MDSFEQGLAGTLDLSDNSTESSSSSKSGLYQTNQPFVLELHDIKKDAPATDKVTPEAKPKKKKRRVQPAAENKTASTTSSTVSIPTVTDSAAKPAAALALVLQQSEHNQDPKRNPQTTIRTSASPREPSNTIKKPVLPQ
ncbi:jg17326 [Pararge aegeria aegeria]|uniref:Jg17326 protein n=1 Tax=Pararge aegeria aegeria TaxID=348720 RepID=A0A8S4SQI3_9NEOP|nr:jg17326 [Pararge aegeria aegeria]